jgi:hypothetical protein
MKRLVSLFVLCVGIAGLAFSAPYTPVSKEANAVASAGSLNSTNVTSVTEDGAGIAHKTVITMAGTATAIADVGFEPSQLLYTFPEGRILIEGATCNMIATMATTNFNATANDLYNVAVGTAVNDDGDGTISATGANIIGNVSVDTGSGQTQTNDVHGTSATGSALQVDGTTTASAVYLNWAVPAANDNGANTNAFTGTITIIWKNLGDY